jgi:hypothetical protein
VGGSRDIRSCNERRKMMVHCAEGGIKERRLCIFALGIAFVCSDQNDSFL